MAALGPELMIIFEREIEEDKARNFKGTARVRFANLVFSDPVRPPNPKDVNRLKIQFEKLGCLRYSLEYSIPVIIEENVLESELARLRITAEEFRNTTRHRPPELQLTSETALDGLDGQHRVLAGALVVPVSEQWWTVELYGQGLTLFTLEPAVLILLQVLQIKHGRGYGKDIAEANLRMGKYFDKYDSLSSKKIT